jgi:hypothetical protein
VCSSLIFHLFSVLQILLNAEEEREKVSLSLLVERFLFFFIFVKQEESF